MNLLFEKLKQSGLATSPALFVAAMLLLWTRPALAGPHTSDGESTFRSKCSICHGADGSGNTATGKKLKMRDLRSEDVQKQSDVQLAEIITKGKGKMQAYDKKLTEEEIKRLVGYIRDLAKKQ